MAFARRTARRSYSRGRSAAGYRRSPVRRAGGRSGSRARSGGQTLKIVVEQAPASAVSRPSLFVGQAKAPSKKARL